MASIGSDFLDLFKQPLLVEGMLALVLFLVVVLLFRRISHIAAEMERRKALGEYVRGLDEFLRGDHREAIGTLEKVLERDPENVEARIALGDCYRELGDAAEAKKHHHHVHKVFCHELARNFVSLGRDELALRNYDRAVEAFERCRELAPQERDALAGLAQAYAEGGNPIAAAQYLRELYPQGPTPELGRARRRLAARRFADAGHAALEEGNAEGAVGFFSEALAFLPESIRARTGLMRAAHELGDEQRARELVAEQLDLLKQLASRDELLFEPAEAAPQDADAPREPPATLLPARVDDVGGVVAAVEKKTARYHCAACGALQRLYADVCPSCGSVGTVSALPALAEVYTRPLADFRAAMDEVEGSPAFFQGLAHKASTGDEQALAKLLERGSAVIYEIFSALPAIEARRYLATLLAALGPEAALEVRQCHAARGGRILGGAAQPHDEFAAAFYLALEGDEAGPHLASLKQAQDAAAAGVMADPRLDAAVRDAAQRRLAGRGEAALAPAVEAAADSGDPGAVERAAALVEDDGGVAVIEKRYLQANLLGRIFLGAHGARRRAAADILARTGLGSARDALSRAAAREKDASLRAHYAAARERAEKGGAR